MKKIFVIAACFMALACSSADRLSESHQKQFTKTMVAQLKLKPFMQKIRNGQVDKSQLAILHTILKNTSEVCIHQQKGASENKVYIHEDGREAVYDAQGQLVRDGVNDGSYNYFHPSEEPLRHFTFDISPWIMLGQTRRDSTTVKERIYAYMGDLEAGIRRTIDQKSEYEQIEWKEKGQVEALSVFLRAIQEGEASELFSLFESEKNPTDEQLIEVLTRLNRGFDIVYAVSQQEGQVGDK